MNYIIFFFLFNVLSSLILLSSSSWWMMWICLEMNTFFFTPWMMESKNLMMSSKSFYYFIVQAFASFVFLICNLLKPFVDLSILISLSMMIKLGSFPFHFWVFEVTEMMEWKKFIFFSSFMKINPWLILLFTCSECYEFFFILPFSILIVLGGLSLWSMRMIMVYSSIVHMVWIISSCMLNQSLSIFYFSCYLLITIITLELFKMNNINSLKDLSKILILESKVFLIFLSIAILSLLGIPPFLGFFMKFVVLKCMIYQNLVIESLLMLIFSIFPMYLYMKIFFLSFMFMKLENLDFFLMSKKVNFKFLVLSFLIYLSLLLWFW